MNSPKAGPLPQANRISAGTAALLGASQKSAFDFRWGTCQSMDSEASELLTELQTRMYSDEGTLIGRLGTALWRIAFEEYRDWLVRAN